MIIKSILIIGTLLGLAGAFAVAQKRYLFGQAIWFFANAFLLTYNVIQWNFWMVLLFGTYQVLTVYAIKELLKKNPVPS